MSLRSFYVALSAVVVGSLVAAIALFFWLAVQSPLDVLSDGKRPDPAAAVFVPKQAPVMASLQVNPDRLEALRIAIANPTARRQARKEIEQFKQGILSERQLNYATDIKPWLGDEITLSVTTPDLDRNPANGQQPGYLLAIETQDGDRARDFLQVFWQKQAIAGSDLVFEPYAGVKLIYGQTVDQAATDGIVQTLATTVVVDRFVLFANSPKVLREAINNVQAPGLNLSSNADYEAALRRVPEHTLGMVYVNLPQLGQWLGQSRSASASRFDRAIAALQLNRYGLLADTALLTAPGFELPFIQPVADRPTTALQFMPEDTPLLVSGLDLNQVWNDLNTGLQDFPLLAELFQQALKPLESQWGMPLSGPLLSWADQEFALGLMPKAGKKQDWLVAAQATEATQPALDELDAIAQNQGLSIGPVDLNGQPTYTWTRLSTAEGRSRRRNTPQIQAEVRGVHTNTRGFELLATSLDAMSQALQAPSRSLAEQGEFKEAIAPIPPANNGFFYVNWSAVRPVLEKRIPLLKLAGLSARPIFDHVRSLTFSSAGGDQQSRQGTLFIRLSDR
ncbi:MULTISPECIES: DUF3352 domain-containing protein [unclassified Leptolyngbya]|uniref:DUF3352 domain-containing protein n=1 Tax=unclassified Leptolyngbya TaxID=2650499 RepID=UPI001687233C|nr:MULTISPECIES: DUF3352 domain-containing protein [unclassified Leptolyngbya]MBD1912295.1 DUF3352 domain-containing protein [Leptolyngbya sp. FACHB-8]MBD2153864.1 DUF3352 domain-containing protein [Leptolyngbya sp. FACHB-16]